MAFIPMMITVYLDVGWRHKMMDESRAKKQKPAAVTMEILTTKNGTEREAKKKG